MHIHIEDIRRDFRANRQNMVTFLVSQAETIKTDDERYRLRSPHNQRWKDRDKKDENLIQTLAFNCNEM